MLLHASSSKTPVVDEDPDRDSESGNVKDEKPGAVGDDLERDRSLHEIPSVVEHAHREDMRSCFQIPQNDPRSVLDVSESAVVKTVHDEPDPTTDVLGQPGHVQCRVLEGGVVLNCER